MAAHIVTIFCEGPHDVAFICRILKTIGCTSFENAKIGDYPVPMNRLIGNEVSHTNIEELNITELRRRFLPSNVLSYNHNYVFLYSLGGDSKKENRQKMLQELLTFIPKPGEIETLPKDTKLSLLYFFDADDKGVDARIEEINKEIKEIVPEFEEDLFEEHAEIKSISKLRVGNFIFTETGDKGKLEDILLPLMEEQNSLIFSEALDFINKHHAPERLHKLKIYKDSDGEIKEKQVKGDKFDHKKSLIGAVGQLQLSGKSNVVCISDANYISLDKIRQNDKCKELADFFIKVTK